MIIRIKGEITEGTAADVAEMVALGEPLEVHIDSKGGDLFAGLDIFNMLQEHKADVQVFIDGVAGSIASVIALGGSSKPFISSTGSIVIHNAHSDNIEGNHNDLRRVADSLEKYSEIVAKIYAKKTRLSNAEALSLMNNETVMNSKDAIELGFAGKEFNEIKALSKLNKVNMKLIDKIKAALTGEVVDNEVITTETTETVDNQEEVGGGFTPEQLAEITALVQQIVAEALSGAPMEASIEEKIGNQVATILNSIVSDGKPPADVEVQEVKPPTATDGMVSFHNKMNEIKENTK